MAERDGITCQGRPTMTVSEYMEVSGLSRSTVYRWLRSSVIPGRKVNETWIINRASALRQLGLCDRQTVASDATR